MWQELLNAGRNAYSGQQGGGGAGVWSFSQSGSADANVGFGDSGLNIGGINTGTQGVSPLMIAAIVGGALVLALVLRR